MQRLHEANCSSTYSRLLRCHSGCSAALPAGISGCNRNRHDSSTVCLRGIRNILAERASISGAEAGCQAEIGAASAMAAAALVYLRGGTPEACGHACAMALKNLLGLVCDPVAGLVEVPCVKRNVVGVVNAISCANMALAGITSRIPADEVIDAMAEVGAAMSADLRETARGGLAATPTAQKIAKDLAAV